MSIPEKYAFWKGVPREEIDWHPVIDENKCIGCGMCITSCGRDVFSYNEKKNKSIVSNPLHCMVGCTSCRTWCIFNAISFPDPQYVKDLIKEHKILIQARKELDEKIQKMGK